MRVLHDLFSRIAGIVHQNFLRGDEDVHGVAISLHVKRAVGRELQQVQAGQVAGGVVEEHVLAARVAGVDAGGVLRGVPAVDGGVVLHAGIAAVPGSFRNFLEQVFGFVGVDYSAVDYGSGGEVGVAHYGYHEVVGYADGVVGVVEEEGTVGVGVGMRSVVTLRDQGVGFGFFFRFAVDEVNDIGMVDV